MRIKRVLESWMVACTTRHIVVFSATGQEIPNKYSANNYLISRVFSRILRRVTWNHRKPIAAHRQDSKSGKKYWSSAGSTEKVVATCDNYYYYTTPCGRTVLAMDLQSYLVQMLRALFPPKMGISNVPSKSWHITLWNFSKNDATTAKMWNTLCIANLIASWAHASSLHVRSMSFESWRYVGLLLPLCSKNDHLHRSCLQQSSIDNAVPF